MEIILCMADFCCFVGFYMLYFCFIYVLATKRTKRIQRSEKGTC